MCCLYYVAWVFSDFSKLIFSFLWIIFPLPLLFLFFYQARFIPVCFWGYCVTCKWTCCLRWHNLPVSQHQHSTPLKRIEKKRDVQAVWAYSYLPMYRCLCASAWVCSLGLWCMFTSEMEIIFNLPIIDSFFACVSLTCCLLETHPITYTHAPI